MTTDEEVQLDPKKAHTIEIVVDRMIVRDFEPVTETLSNGTTIEQPNPNRTRSPMSQRPRACATAGDIWAGSAPACRSALMRATRLACRDGWKSEKTKSSCASISSRAPLSDPSARDPVGSQRLPPLQRRAGAPSRHAALSSASGFRRWQTRPGGQFSHRTADGPSERVCRTEAAWHGACMSSD